MKKPPLGKLPKLEPRGTCLAGPLYEFYHGKDGLKVVDGKLAGPCPYCILYMPCPN